MALFEYRLPELGEGIEDGDVIQILVAIGDAISRDQPVIELETDKAVIEVPAPADGVVQLIHVQEGAKAKVGQLLISMQTSDVEPAMTTQSVQPDEAVVPQAAPVDAPEAPLSAEEAIATPPVADRTTQLDKPSQAGGAPAAPAAPSVRRLARELGIDINRVAGTGPAGRIGEQDVKHFARAAMTEQAPAQSALHGTSDQLPDFSQWGSIDRQPMTNVRQVTAQTMSRAWNTIPHVTQFGKADTTELEKLRQRYAQRAVAAGGKLTITAILLKAVVAVLKRLSQFNASIDMTHREVIYKHYYHIGVAVDTDRGLLVPVIRDVNHKSILDLSIELSDIAERARSRKLRREDMQGGTFTLTNLGGIGGSAFSPIINPPEVAILGIARSRIEPVYVDQAFEPRSMLPLALSYDHRLIDGADGARFIEELINLLEDPFLISLEG